MWLDDEIGNFEYDGEKSDWVSDLRGGEKGECDWSKSWVEDGIIDATGISDVGVDKVGMWGRTCDYIVCIGRLLAKKVSK